MGDDRERSAPGRTILHVDMDAFYASVEQRRHPDLRGRPVIVGAKGPRGVVAAASYEARAYGVRSAMPSLRAERLCPGAVFLDGDHGHYAEVSAAIMEVFRSFTPLVEPLSLDEAFLDVTGALRLHGDGPTIARAIRHRIAEEQSLTCSVGVASSKFVAKLATEQGKPTASRSGPIPGVGVTVVAAGYERAFLDPLPVEALWGVGPRTLEKLQRIGVRRVADLAALPVESVIAATGSAAGAQLHRLARGIDERPVVADAALKSIGHEETFAADVADRSVLDGHLVRMADAVTSRARRHGSPGRTVTIKVRFGDFRTITRSRSVPRPIRSTAALVALARPLLEAVEVDEGVRLLGVSLSNLGEAVDEQLHLDLDGPPERSEGDSAAWDAVTDAVDAVRARFGDRAVGPGSVVGGRTRPAPGSRPWGPGSPEPDDG